MQEITINNKKYLVTITQAGCEVEFDNEETGLKKVIVFDELSITPSRIRTTTTSFDVTPTGKRINALKKIRQTPPKDFQFFIESALGESIKKSLANGIFRFVLGVTDKVYNEAGNLITDQPFSIPQPPEE
jgi:hypothetical protein